MRAFANASKTFYRRELSNIVVLYIHELEHFYRHSNPQTLFDWLP